MKLCKWMLMMVILGIGIYGCGGGGGQSSSSSSPINSGDGGNGGGGGGDVIPLAPTGVSATAGNGQATLSWNVVDRATSYNIYVSTASGVTKTNWERQDSASSSPMVITGLINETPYYFIVTAVNSAGESVESAEVSATPISPRWMLSTGEASIIVVAPDKSVYVGGGLFSSAVSKFSADGRLLWVYDTWDVSGNKRYHLHGVGVRSNGEVYISRSIYDISTFSQREFVEELDISTGAVLWNTEISSCGSGSSPGLTVNEYGVFAAGFECIAGLDFDGNILGYSYIPNISGPGGSGGINSIVTDGINIYVTGNTAGDSFAPNAGGQDIFLAKYDQNGNLLWGKQWGGIDFELGPGICFDATANSVFVASGGWISSFKEDINLTLSHFDVSGNLIMEKTFPDIKSGWGTALECENGKVYVGYAFRNNLGWEQSMLMSTDQNGIILWNKALPLGSYWQTANAIKVDSTSEKIFLGVVDEKLLIYSLTGEPLN